MTSTIIPALKKLMSYEKVNVIDVGAARGSFIEELAGVFVEAGLGDNEIYSIGIDPFHREAEEKYDTFIRACVDNVESPREEDLYIHDKDDQAHSLCISVLEDGGTGEFYPADSRRKVWVLNLNTIIDYHWWLFDEQIIHFLKIDAEGKDLDIVESLSQENLKRIKYIALECKNGAPRYEGDRDIDECIEYMKSIGFDVSFRWDADNNSQLSDVVFVNREEL
jgi:hypothetical protein